MVHAIVWQKHSRLNEVCQGFFGLRMKSEDCRGKIKKHAANSAERVRGVLSNECHAAKLLPIDHFSGFRIEEVHFRHVKIDLHFLIQLRF